jgi:hypothetical protein
VRKKKKPGEKACVRGEGEEEDKKKKREKKPGEEACVRGEGEEEDKKNQGRA